MSRNDLTLEPLVDRLERLADDIEYPATPPIADEVMAAISPSRRSQYLPYALVAVAFVVVLLTAPQVRSAMWEALDVIGIDIRIAEEQRSREELPLLDESLFGLPVTLEEAEEAFAGDLAFPSAVLPTVPDSVYLHTDPSGLVSVTYVYAATDDLPAMGESNIGAILTQITGPEETPYLAKTVFDTDHQVFVTEHNVQAQWIGRGEVSLRDDPHAWRSSANVLIWLDGTTGFRFESALTQADSLKVAESMVPEDERN